MQAKYANRTAYQKMVKRKAKNGERLNAKDKNWLDQHRQVDAQAKR